MDPARRLWHRDGIPAWGWVAIVVMRVAALLWALVPLALLVAGIWWWTHGGARRAPLLLKQAVHQMRAAADSLFGK